MNDENKEKFADFLATECRALLIEHLDAVIEAAFETQDDDKPAKAKVSLSFAWEADEPYPRVTSKLGYTVSHKDETERRFDPNQTDFFADIEGVDQVTCKVGDGPEVTLPDQQHPFQLANSQLHDAPSREAVIESANEAKLERILAEDCGPPLQKALRKKAEARLKKLRNQSAA